MTKLDKSILIVEDEADLANMLRFNLEREGYRCRCVADGADALTEARADRPDLILLDRMLPRLSGDEVVAKLKRNPQSAAIPIILLTAKAEETDQLVGFALGADDYVTKPFSFKLLLARIAALLRRRDELDVDDDEIEEGPVKLIPDRHEVTVDGEPVRLTATEFRLLKVLMTAKRRVFDRSRLIDAVFGETVAITDRTIDVHITAVRKKLGHAAGWVQTVRGVGYTFRPPESLHDQER